MFDIGKYQDIVRCAKSDNLTESDRETEKLMRKVCLTEHSFISDFVISHCPRGTLQETRYSLLLGADFLLFFGQRE